VRCCTPLYPVFPRQSSKLPASGVQLTLDDGSTESILYSDSNPESQSKEGWRNDTKCSRKGKMCKKINGGLLYRYNHNNSCTSVWYIWVVQIASSLAIYSMNFIRSECYCQTSGCCCLGLSCEVLFLVCLHYMQ